MLRRAPHTQRLGAGVSRMAAEQRVSAVCAARIQIGLARPDLRRDGQTWDNRNGV